MRKPQCRSAVCLHVWNPPIASVRIPTVHNLISASSLRHATSAAGAVLEEKAGAAVWGGEGDRVPSFWGDSPYHTQVTGGWSMSTYLPGNFQPGRVANFQPGFANCEFRDCDFFHKNKQKFRDFLKKRQKKQSLSSVPDHILNPILVHGMLASG